MGHICISVVIDRKGELADELDIEIYGVPHMDQAGEYMEDRLLAAAASALAGIPKKRRKDTDMIRDAVRQSVRREARNQWGKKPVTTVFVSRV